MANLRRPDPELLSVLREVQKRSEKLDLLDFHELTFGSQREFIADESRLKVACCSRRSGKSHGVAILLLKHALQKPGCTPVYINMNRASAQLIIWPALRDLSNKFDLNLQFIKSSGDVIVPNGSEIRVFGAGSMREMDKVRGVGTTLTIACLDEAQNFGADMEYLIRSVILPATADHKAPIVVTGTPNQTCAGPFHEICHQSGEMVEALAKEGFGWSVHGWTMKENPYIKDVEEEYLLAKAANGWNDNTPAFRREYFGEWVRDTAGLCFDLHESMFVEEFPEGDAEDWVYPLGIDIGTKDPCAFTVMAFSPTLGVTYVLQSYRDQFDTIEAGNEFDRLMQVYPIEVGVVDAGGMGARDIDLWKKTHPWLPAIKAVKGPGSVDMGISIINADMRAGKVKFLRKGCAQLIDEMRLLSWDEDLRGIGRRTVKKGDHDHCADSFRYGFQRVRTHDTPVTFPKEVVEKDTEVWLAHKARALKKEALKEPVQKPTWVGVDFQKF